jgi:hypothetical protein
MQYICTISDITSMCSLAVTRWSFFSRAQRELSVTLVQSQGYVYCCCALLLVTAVGRQVLHGADTLFLH